MDIEDIATKVEGVWLPKDEIHLLEWMQNSKGRHVENGVACYQWKKQQYARDAMRQHIPDWPHKVFVDVGAHVGLWSMWWGPIMAGVVAFEPIPEMRRIYAANMTDRGNYLLVEAALGDTIGNIELSFNPQNTGNTHQAHSKDAPGTLTLAPMTTLDAKFGSMPTMPRIGVIKIDCEGVEEAVVRGGEKVIREHKPLIIVEQKKGAAYYGADPEGAVTLLKSWGYRVVKEISGDYIMAHGDLMH